MKQGQSTIIGSMAFTGDIFIPGGINRMYFSPRLENILASCQIRACNMEAPIKGVGEKQLKAGPHLHQSAAAPEILEDAGFNLINLANNHICDFGLQALIKTKEAFSVPTTGAGRSFAEAGRAETITVGGVKVAFLSFGEAEFGAIIEDGGGFAWINHPQTDEMIVETKKQNDILVVQVHAGVEQTEIPLPEWRTRYKTLIDLGADAIIASHPHVPQGWEEYKGKPIFYSLGNFFFANDNKHPLWNKGLLVKIDICSDLSLAYKCMGIERKGDKVDTLESEEFSKYLSHLCDSLTEPVYTALINKIAVDLWNRHYRRHYENAINGVSRFNITHLLKFIKRLLSGKGMNIPVLIHNTRIESHYWIVRRALNQLYIKECKYGNKL